KIREEIMISYNDEVLERLFLLTVKFVNDGDVGVNGKTDIVERIEISLREDNCKIIGEPKILENPSDINLTFYPTTDQKTIKFDFDLMNSNDYFLMDLFYTGDELADPNVHAKIVDIKDIEIRSKMESSGEEQKKNLTLILAGFLFVVMGFNMRSEKFRTLWTESVGGIIMKKKILILLLPLSYVVLGSFMFYTGTWRIASRLYYENSLIGFVIFLFFTISVLTYIIKDTFFARK
ncbi:MAG: hypothetical protein KAT65_19195, partial [Methanophagales archaeon]|nr:hypothetical protein [Methanophagales archaeon]